ncbi:hypothetical protein H0H93_012382 [Arthromyces matolae]|nr:hypothetical protein H0H93_012382 [Arthromyces matolae]
MAQAATMGPPLSPRETRRSGRRSVPSASASASKSPDSDPPPKQKEIPNRPPLTSNNSTARQKRLKQEDVDDIVDDRKNGSAPSTSSSSSNSTTNSNRTKRKLKDKDKQVAIEPVVSEDIIEDPSLNPPLDVPEEEEQGITRCVCGSTGEDDPDAGEFMVQCETCKVWQHGLCMGFESEDQLYDDDYYCEECKPELHMDLFKKRSKRPRQSSANAHHNSTQSRVSRSHSPSTLLKQPSKRRNTMNSRDAAFDESLKEIIEATAAEAAAAQDNSSVASAGTRDIAPTGEDGGEGTNNRRKRKRADDDTQPKKRTRSASTASDHPESVIRDTTPGQAKAPTQLISAPSKSARSNKRGGKKSVPATLNLDALATVDGDEVQPSPSVAKRPGSNNRAKSSQGHKRPPASHSHNPADGTVRRSNAPGQPPGSSMGESNRAYRNSHAYAVSQQPLYTSWNLPDYLAHLEPMLPTGAPQPLEVRGGASGAGGSESAEHTVERGVKIKWPAKRMSVGDMNKRVRSLVEWVGREQATAQDRIRRRAALAKAYQEEVKNLGRTEHEEVQAEEATASVNPDLDENATTLMLQLDNSQSSATMKMMEELMEELIRFQERFGPDVVYISADETQMTRPSSPAHFDRVLTQAHSGDYNAQMDELFSDDDGVPGAYGDIENDDDDDEGFVYAGVDASSPPSGYSAQLRDVLGSEVSDDEIEAYQGQPRSLFQEDDGPPAVSLGQLYNPVFDVLTLHFKHKDTIIEDDASPLPLNASGSNGNVNISRPFLPPNVSRLRSFTPSASRPASNEGSGSSMTSPSHHPGRMSPPPLNLPSISRTSSRSDLRPVDDEGSRGTTSSDAFKWTTLSNISKHVYNPLSQKLSSVLGAPLLGTPTVFTANGLICIGTTQGRVCIFDFKQKLKCVCGIDSPGKPVGAVTAVALSHDHTYVATGHASGHLQLFDLKNPKVPTRFVPPTTLEAVASGRKEGHIEGSRIISIAFIAERHTAVVSSDDHGLAFAHSLGKMLFIEAPDILRILGQYQSDAHQRPSLSKDTITLQESIPDTTIPRRRRSRYTILATSPLPLGASHLTTPYNIIAMLTPSKLVIVGLKPTPRTWFKYPRNTIKGSSSSAASKARGTLAWRPPQPKVVHPTDNDINSSEAPVLVFTWGCTLRLIRVDEFRSKEMVQSSRANKQVEADVGRIVYQDVGSWSAEDDILAVHWLNVDQIAVMSAHILQVLDARSLNVVESVSFEALSLASPILANGAGPYSDCVSDVTHSIYVYKGKMFLLGKDGLQVGTLLTWADRILSLVEEGDFLNAIDLTRSYYVGEAPGNRNGLPEDPILRKEVIGGKMRDLMVASASYTFSEDRMTDGTHFTPDGRGVDRTAVFEDLVTVSCRASIALDDYEFLFEDLFQRFDDAGITQIFLQQLEPFVLKKEIHTLAPRISQRLVALHEDDGRPDRIERIIWHIDPSCLDINQVIHLCQKHNLYDALIYVYTRALRDFVAPVVELLELIKKVQQFKRTKNSNTVNKSDLDIEARMEPIILNAYKVYPYLAAILCGLSYPSEDQLPDEDALRAKNEVYTFLFFGRSSVWPSGEGSKLVLTADEEGGDEPPYPYIRLLLRFDAESFLHSLDIAFEDPFLNDESQSTNRLVIVRILLEIVAARDLSPTDSTLVNIFIARNVPKYPQFFTLVSPSTLHDILKSLAEDPDSSTREDRQLATEYLLSAYNPHDGEGITRLFESAGFYRILRSWHRHDHHLGPLISAYLCDQDLRPSEVLPCLDEVITTHCHANRGLISPDVHTTLSISLARLLEISVQETATLINKHVPDLHEAALQLLPDNHNKLIYLHHLLGPPDHDGESQSWKGQPLRLSPALCQLYISLQCQQHPYTVVQVLECLPAGLVDWSSILLTCETEGVYDAVVWAMNRRGHPQEALTKAEGYQKRLTEELGDLMVDSLDREVEIRRHLQSLASIAGVAVGVCLEHSRTALKTEMPLEDIWFQLLSSQIHSVQALSPVPLEQTDALVTLRSLVHQTFDSLVSVASIQAISFPRLFKRLVESAPQSIHAHYTEFRTILTGMLESYRTEGDMLLITKHLVDRDLFQTMAGFVRERERGWTYKNSCAHCRKPLFNNVDATKMGGAMSHALTNVIIFRTGMAYHNACSP